MIVRALAILRRIELAAAMLTLAAIVTVVFIGAVGRYSGHPVLWSDELAQALFVWLSLLAADLTLQRAGHFRLDMLSNFLPAGLQVALSVFTQFLVGALLLLLLFYGLAFVQISHLRPLPMIGVPSSFATVALPVGFGLMIVTLIEQTIREVASGRVKRSEVSDVT